MRRQPEFFATAVRAFKEMTAAADDAAATRARVLAAADRGARVQRTPRRIAVTTAIALLVICSASVAGTTLAQRWRRPAAVAIEETPTVAKVGSSDRSDRSDRRLAPKIAPRSSFRPSLRRSTTRLRPDRRTPSPTPTGSPTAPTSMKALQSALSPPGTTTCGFTPRARSNPRRASIARSAWCGCGALRRPSARSGRSPTDASATTAALRRNSSSPGCTTAGPRRKRRTAKLDRTSRKCRSVVCRRPWMLFSAWRRRLFFFGGRTSSSESSGWVTSTSSTW